MPSEKLPYLIIYIVLDLPIKYYTRDTSKFQLLKLIHFALEYLTFIKVVPYANFLLQNIYYELFFSC